MNSRSLLVDGSVFFLVIAILVIFFQVFSDTDYYFGEEPLIGIGLVVMTLINVAAAYGTWRVKRWGFTLALVANLIYVVGFYASTIVPPFGFGPVDALYGSIDITVRFLVMFFAFEALWGGRPTV